MAKTPVIAIVDDDEGVRASLASLVRSLGYEAHAYESGVAFLREPADEDPACMIADVQMPVITGDELQARLVASGRLFPIIFMTAFPSEPVRQRVMAAGAHCYLGKPSSGDEIIRRLEEALAGHAPQ
ncbi:FixJ family two-component response regulator [Bradyrhizobium japonicum]|jgi:FixJ family two-component response regulator|uniref:response regulator transcription factor n=1 Tax=Bradyrhizobium TaxID=374 RepID=UPI0004B8C7D3|nr:MULTISPECIES: response regulator [Bradyrhizobium]MBR0880442.1 response regulator [Bradyrhizobium liaoningense]MBR0939818.1 response regulator [Bradyrhizobium liaoningense]MBR1025315.1 response regulator [Bradyrhizobium liaoningense]MCP1778282.1 FixJ family two-component response regulator [Bradyrhizobium japonicum]MCP1958720.1 FixJ family two-component response regulator [Bradyrhizobium japonicum]